VEEVKRAVAELEGNSDVPAARGNLRVITLEKGSAADRAEALQKLLPKMRANPVKVIVPGQKPAPAPKPAPPTAPPTRQTAPPTRQTAPPTPAPRPPAATTPRSDIIDTVKSDERRPAPPTRATDDKSLSSAKEEPLVKRFLEVFRGDIAQVKPPKGDT